MFKLFNKKMPDLKSEVKINLEDYSVSKVKGSKGRQNNIASLFDETDKNEYFEKSYTEGIEYKYKRKFIKADIVLDIDSEVGNETLTVIVNDLCLGYVPKSRQKYYETKKDSLIMIYGGDYALYQGLKLNREEVKDKFKIKLLNPIEMK